MTSFLSSGTPRQTKFRRKTRICLDACLRKHSPRSISGAAHCQPVDGQHCWVQWPGLYLAQGYYCVNPVKLKLAMIILVVSSTGYPFGQDALICATSTLLQNNSPTEIKEKNSLNFSLSQDSDDLFLSDIHMVVIQSVTLALAIFGNT